MRSLFPQASFLAAILFLGGCVSTPHGAPTPPSGAAPAAMLTSKSAATLYLGALAGLVKEKRYGAALAFLNRYAVSGKSRVPRYWLLRGEAEMGLARPREAASAFIHLNNTALAAQGWNGQGRAAAAHGNWQAADAAFHKAQAIDPANANFLNNLAFAELHLGKSAAAIGFLRQARELKPHNNLIRDNLLIALTMQGDRQGAENILHRVRDSARRGKLRASVAALLRTGAFLAENPS